MKNDLTFLVFALVHNRKSGFQSRNVVGSVSSPSTVLQMAATLDGETVTKVRFGFEWKEKTKKGYVE